MNSVIANRGWRQTRRKVGSNRQVGWVAIALLLGQAIQNAFDARVLVHALFLIGDAGGAI